MSEHFGKGNTLQHSKRIVTREAVARNSWTGDAAKKARQGTLGAQGRVTLRSQGIDGSDTCDRDFPLRTSRRHARFDARTASAMPAIRIHRLPEIGDEPTSETSRSGSEIHDSIQSGEVFFFAGSEESI